MTSCEPVAAFCSSDEEGEDENMLSFLPIAPEIEDPEVYYEVVLFIKKKNRF